VPKQKLFTASEIIKKLTTSGFILISRKGSHKKFKNPKTGYQVIVPEHKGKIIPIGTLKAIIEGSGTNPEIWK
jgi:predicted RNA binding protein YcfA (HicA-like mRNA interferase family)